MLGMRTKSPINAGDELAKREGEREGISEPVRGKADLGGRRVKVMGGGKVLMGIMLIFALGAGAVFVAKTAEVRKEHGKKEPVQQVKNTNAGFKVPDLLPGPTPEEQIALQGGPDAALVPVSNGAPGQVPAIGGGPPDTTATPPASASDGPPPPPKPTPAELLHQRRLSGDFGSGDRMSAQPTAPRAAAVESDDTGGGGELQRMLTPIKLTAQQAARLGDRNTLLTQGAIIDCVLETKIVSTVAGMTSCHLTRDVYSSNGRVVLLDRGSKVVGFYQGGINQGEARIFVQWSRVETPKGVVINLDSPGAGSLGEAGLGGYIDTHFRERFGGAILLSLIDDLGDWFANKNSDASQSQTVQFGNSASAAKELANTTLQNSINVKPTLYKNQGERITIFVARDLDFRDVYALARR